MEVRVRALHSLLTRDRLAVAGPEGSVPRPLRAHAGHLPASARSVIFCFMDGGPSHLDTFDRKPLINELAGQPLPKSVERVITPMGISENPLLPSQRSWKRYGESGLEI